MNAQQETTRQRRRQAEQEKSLNEAMRTKANYPEPVADTANELSSIERDLVNEGTWEELMAEFVSRLTSNRQYDQIVYAIKSQILEALNSKRR